jgi:hypothetical protein
MRVYRFGFVVIAPVLLGASEPAPSPSPSPTAAPGDFCQRLAQNIGVKVHPKAPGPTTWTIDAVPFIRLLVPIPGSVATGMGARPIEPASAADYRRVDEMCQPDGKGAVCRLLGPVRFSFLWRGARTFSLIYPGERARVRIVSTRTTCQAGVS